MSLPVEACSHGVLLPYSISNEGNRRAQGQFCLPRPFFLGESIHSARDSRSQLGSTWPQVPIETAGLLAGPTQSGVLEAQLSASATGRGLTFSAHPVSRAGCLRPGLSCFSTAAASRRRSLSGR